MVKKRLFSVNGMKMIALNNYSKEPIQTRPLCFNKWDLCIVLLKICELSVGKVKRFQNFNRW